MKSYLSLIFITLVALNSFANELPDSTLHRYVAQMLMVGFKGDTLSENCDAIRYVRDLKVGSIILFDVDLTGSAKIGSRNITNKSKLQKLTSTLQAINEEELIIAIDQEGGKVARLKPQYGFKPTVSAEYLGTVNSKDTTTFYANQLADEIEESGINMNLAPDIDVNVNPQSPAIGKIQRSFSSDTAIVTNNARWFIDAHHNHNISVAVKHFPGHGSSTDDSHYGLTDVTTTWKGYELAPFKQLINEGKIDAVMTAHIFNGNIDKDYPATLSYKTLTGVLRNELGFDGVIITDDMYMQGIINHYSIEEAVILAINAGANMLLMGNNISTGYEPERPFVITNMIVKAVKDGRIKEELIIDSYNKIQTLKNTLSKQLLTYSSRVI